MKVLSTEGLTKLIQLIKGAFISNTDVVETSELTLATVATTGSYNDLSNKPTIPTVNNATLTIQKNGTQVATFTANSSTDATANITVPTDTNDLTNGAGYITGITSSDVTTALGYTPYNSTNPSGYQANVIETVKVNGTALTPSSKAVDITVPTDTNDLTNGAGYITSSALNGYATETWVGQQGFLTSTALSNYVTINTNQTITSQKTFKYTETAFQDSVARFVSTYQSSNQGWRGRVIIGAKDYTFIIGTYNGMAAIGGHKFTDSSTEAGATWSDIYFQPDGDKAIYFGGWSWTQNSGWFKVQNNASNTSGKVQVNTGTISSANWKDVAYKGENVSDFSFTSISGYNASKTQTLKHINGTLTWVDD